MVLEIISGIDSNSNCRSITLQVCNSFTRICLKKRTIAKIGLYNPIL
ncbi:hypothetical protein LEP1GSC062_2194 [Leptospira alexanderi serovar Manhao 3 str. L 60]|uniref:Uncharacterized protein n=1 Tax=Leptospira alexanderi serovar Manhao 3 str. L 60 TaxID=1049759 RepID=V6HYJ5_9LEPT|nr:hypothetical protein LEP1GSC062_2194 [Leptospira alexanderi serovar Manhao 3 str. L 60]